MRPVLLARLTLTPPNVEARRTRNVESTDNEELGKW